MLFFIGNLGFHVFKRGIQNEVVIWPKINVLTSRKLLYFEKKYSVCPYSHRKKPVLITEILFSLQEITCLQNREFPTRPCSTLYGIAVYVSLKNKTPTYLEIILKTLLI